MHEPANLLGAVATMSSATGVPAVALVAPDRAQRMLERSQGWVTAHARELRAWLSLAFGTALVVDALVRIST